MTLKTQNIIDKMNQIANSEKQITKHNEQCLHHQKKNHRPINHPKSSLHTLKRWDLVQLAVVAAERNFLEPANMKKNKYYKYNYDIGNQN
jgi:hypothetical protein